MNQTNQNFLSPELPEFFKEVFKGSNKATSTTALNRRQFFKISSIAGGGLALGLSLGQSKKALAQFGSGNLSALTPFIQIQSNGRINIFSKNPECGQGIKTGLPLIIAEELDVRWEDVDVLQAPIDASTFGAQLAGGSTSTPTNWMPMRIAGASARAMILAAAATRLSIPVNELSTSQGKVIHSATESEYSYGEFAELAATLPVPDPESLQLKDKSEFTLLGKRYTGVDNESIVQGKPLFGIDQTPENLVYASYTKCPRIGGTVASFNEAFIKSLAGVQDAFILEPDGEAVNFNPMAGMFGGVAIIANSTWASFRAKQQLEIEWDYSTAASATWSELSTNAGKLAAQDGDMELSNTGDVDTAMNNAETVVEGYYEYAYVSHANLEPQNCTALVQNGVATVWAPTQVPNNCRAGIATLLGFPAENVELLQTRIGGGFGRRIANDYAFESVAIANKVQGKAVKLTWTREDDLSGGYFRPGAFHSYKAAINEQGQLDAFQDHFITSTVNGTAPISMAGISPNVFPMDVLENVKLTQSLQQAYIPTGPMRAPQSNVFGFSFQSFLHECSVAAKRDHLEFLVELCGEPRQLETGMHTGRAADVIKEVARRANWGRSMPANRALGLSFYYSHSGYVAQVADVSVNENKEVTVHKVWAVSDFGFIHNLSSAENQVEGSIIDGLSQMMYQKVTFTNGAIDQSNFHQYPLLRHAKTPALDVAFLESEFPPTGAGEPALPPLAAAVGNAIFSANGDRVRKMPLSDLGYTLA